MESLKTHPKNDEVFDSFFLNEPMLAIVNIKRDFAHRHLLNFQVFIWLKANTDHCQMTEKNSPCVCVCMCVKFPRKPIPDS